jgi:Tc5 transposase DNA-binding domain
LGLTAPRGHANTEYRQRLNKAQEEVLLGYIDSLIDKHIPPTTQIVKNLAEELLKGPVGKNWTASFVRRHKQRISSIGLRPLDRARVSAENTAVFEHFYRLVLFF